MSDRARLLLAVLLAAWTISFGLSFYLFAVTEPSGDGFTRGMNRAGLFLGWQAVAGLLALAAFAVGRGAPKGSGIRRVSAVPFYLALSLIAAFVAFYVWAMTMA